MKTSTLRIVLVAGVLLALAAACGDTPDTPTAVATTGGASATVQPSATSQTVPTATQPPQATPTSPTVLTPTATRVAPTATPTPRPPTPTPTATPVPGGKPVKFEQALGSSLTFPDGGGVTGIASGDFNGDGRLDIAVSQVTNIPGVGERGNISIMIGGGDGTFAAPAHIPAESVQGILARDVNGDGRLDLLVASSGQGGVLFFRGNGDGTFANPVLSQTGLPPLGKIATGDLNGDGRLDVLMLHLNSTLSVMMGTGDGRFGTPSYYTAGNNPQDIAVGDVNGDGFTDVVVAGYNSRTVEALFNNTLGGLGNAIASDSRIETTGLYLADFDGDGILDATVSGNAGPVFFNMAFMKGNGDGTFRAPADNTFIPIEYGPSRGLSDNTSADLNGDGHLDVVWVGENNFVTVAHGDGTGKFTTAFWVASPGPGTGTGQLDGSTPSGLVTGDFNGDGRQDVVVGSAQRNPRPGGVSVLLGKTGGAFQAARSYPGARAWSSTEQSTVLADLNGDGRLDLALISDALDVLTGSGSGTFSGTVTGMGHTSGPGEFYNTLQVADFDKDGNLDLVFLATDGVQGGPLPRHLVGFGNGNGTFALQATLLPRVADWGGRNMAVADFDRDGYLDLAIFTKALYGNAAEVGIYLNNGAAGRGFTAAPVLDIGPVSGTTIPGAGIAAADFNRDGLLDIVVHSGVTNDPFEGSSNDRLLLFTGRGDGTFNAASVVGTGLPEVDEFAAGDLNGDGRMDLVGIGGSVWVLMGNGDGTFAEQVAYGAGGNPVALQLIDMNGDRVLDIAAGATNGAFSVLRGNGNGTFQDAQLFAIGMVGALTVSVGDLNGDGLQDVVVGHPSTNRNSFTVLIQQP